MGHIFFLNIFEEGIRVGVPAILTFVVNGWLLKDAQSLESFVRVIQEELARVRLRR